MSSIQYKKTQKLEQKYKKENLFTTSWNLKSIDVRTDLLAFLCSKLSNTLNTKSCTNYDSCSVQTTNFRTRSRLELGKVKLLQNPSEIGDAVEKP